MAKGGLNLKEFGGHVREGRVELDDKIAWSALLSRLDGKRVRVSLDSVDKQRSSQQNRWYWACLVPIAAEVLSQGRTVPLSKEQAHYVLASAFLGCEETDLGPVPMKTSKLSTKDFSLYCEKIVAHMQTEWKIAVPMPGERMEADL